MTAKMIKGRISEICTLFGFEYNGKSGNVDPYYIPGKGNEFLLYFDGNEQTVCTVDEAMQAPFIEGNSLNDLYDKIVITEW